MRQSTVSACIYGELFTKAGERNFALGSGVDLLEIGHGTASSKFWEGYLDEFELYDRVLSQEQIYQIYLSTISNH